jgi:hypothetical protein
MKKYLIVFYCLFCSWAHAQKQMEALNRGLTALNKNGTVYLNWRLYALEDYTVGFNIYRSANGGAFTKLNTAEITATTDFLDKTANLTVANTYYVAPVLKGVDQLKSEMCTLAANTPSRKFFPINLQAISGKAFTDYNIVHIYPGDFDGDGDFDYLVKRVPVDATTNTILLDCYNNEGVFKWRIDLGPNIETYIGTMTSPVVVADFDSDGKAEIIAKTGESTIFGNGVKIGDTDGDGKTDYNGHQGLGNAANVMAGPEFISLIDGETGAEVDRDNFLARGNPCDWGDCYGARMNFIMSSIGYFDGVRPGAVFSRGDGGHMTVDAWQVSSNKLVRIWAYSSIGKTYALNGWTDFHQIQCIDVDGDGKDEVSWGACMLDHDGKFLYTTKYHHGDRFQITDIDPNRAGLEVFIVQQYNPDLIGSALYDAKTGATIKDWYIPASGDIGRGDAADIDPNSPGLELFDTGTPNLHDAKGKEITGSKPFPWVSIWWDGDLLRENFIGVGAEGFNPAINKWNTTNNSEDRMFSIYNDWGAYSVKMPYGGRVPLLGDIFGDWREEIFLQSSDGTSFRIYTTDIPSTTRLYTLMQNPAYRTAITAKMYLCTKYTDYFLGAGMDTPPKPNIVLVGKLNDCNGVKGGTAVIDECGICVAGNTGKVACVKDCNGTVSGTAKLDVCGRCIGGTTAKTACTSVGEAETDACAFVGITETKNAGYKGTSYLNVDNAVGTSITFNVLAANAGTATLSFRYANGGTVDRPAQISLNGTILPNNLSFPVTEDFTTWKAVDVSLSFIQGTNVVKLISATAEGLGNIDQIGYVSAGVSKGSCLITGTSNLELETLNNVIYPNPFYDYLNINQRGDFGYQISTINGSEIESGKGHDHLEIGHTLVPGLYMIKIQTEGTSQTFKFLKGGK